MTKKTCHLSILQLQFNSNFSKTIIENMLSRYHYSTTNNNIFCRHFHEKQALYGTRIHGFPRRIHIQLYCLQSSTFQCNQQKKTSLEEAVQSFVLCFDHSHLHLSTIRIQLNFKESKNDIGSNHNQNMYHIILKAFYIYVFKYLPFITCGSVTTSNSLICSEV